GVLPAALKAAAAGRTLIVPRQNGAEAALVSAADVRAAGSLLEVLAFLRGVTDLPPAQTLATEAAESGGADLADVRGQLHARRAPGRVSSRVPARRGDESVSVRVCRRPVGPLRVHARSDPPLPRTHFRSAARPHRPSGRSAARTAGRTRRRRRGRRIERNRA